MELQRRALYNLLRMNWQQDKTVEAESWQIEDYRALSTEKLFDRLTTFDIHLDNTSFVSYSDGCDTPEELSDSFLADRHLNVTVEDQIYLIVFEIWRRLVNEKQSLSIFCDELDHLIHHYDEGDTSSLEPLEDALGNLQVLLEENRDQGNDPHTIFDAIASSCANNLEDFLYDFIAEQIDNENYDYATELLEGFYNYVSEPTWFDLLKARILIPSEIEASNEIIRELAQDAPKERNLDLCLEILSTMAQGGEHKVFQELVKKTIPILKVEGDFQDLLFVTAEYYHRLDRDDEALLIEKLTESRESHSVEEQLDTKDPAVLQLLKVIAS